MASIRSIIRNAKGTAGAWRVTRDTHVVGREDDVRAHTVERATLWHYGTPMIRWNIDDPADRDVLDFDLGWGSVSDQNGLNTFFRVHGLSYRMDRDCRGGGPRITGLTPTS